MGKKKTTTPKEHGFWVLLLLSVMTALARFPNRMAFLTAIAVAITTILAAMIIGRRIRKNPLLQASASVLLAFTVWPIALAGGGTHAEAASVALPLATIFLAGTFCVRAILERARKMPGRALASGLASVLIPAAAAVSFWFLWGPWTAGALAITTCYTLGVLALAVSPKKLKMIGLSISLAHFASTLLLAM